MLKVVETYIKGEKDTILLVNKKKTGKKDLKWKLNPKSSTFKKKKKAKDVTYFYCGKLGHWKKKLQEFFCKREAGCKQYTKGYIYMIQTTLSLSHSASDNWVLDTAYSSHIYKSLQGLQKNWRLKKSDFKLFGASRETIYVEAIGTYLLKLLSDRILE